MKHTVKNFRTLFGSQLALLLAAALWGSSFVFTKSLFATEPAITSHIILLGRLFVASLVFVPFLLITKRLQPIQKGDLWMLLLLAFCETVLHMSLETSGIKLIPSSLAAIIVATCPLIVPFGMRLVYKERLSPWVILGVLLSLVGIAAMSLFDRSNAEGSVRPMGVVLLCLAVLTAATYTLMLVKILKRYTPYTITAYQNLFGLLFYIPIVLVFNHDSLPLLSYSWGMLGRIAFLGLFCSTGAYVLYNYGIKVSGATAASVYNNLIPVFTLIVAVALGMEALSWVKVVGVAVVLTGLFLAQRK